MIVCFGIPTHKVSMRRLATLAFCVAILLLAGTAAPGQQLPSVGGVGGNMQIPTAGGHDYIHMLAETVNPSTGALTIRINLPTPKGRGITAPAVVAYNSGELNSLIEPSGAPLWATSPENPNGQASGWGSGFTQPLSAVSSIYNFVSPAPPGTDPAVNCNIITGFSLTDLSGMQHTLYSGAQYLAYGALPESSCPDSLTNTGITDGQFTGFIPATNTAGTATTTLLANGNAVPMTAIDIYGNTYYYTSGTVGQYQAASSATMEDRNGNILTNTTDTAGRTPVFQLSPVAGTYPVYGLDYTVATTTTTVNYTPTESSMIIEGGADNCNVTSNFGANSATITVISSITLPDGQKYEFQYDPTYGTVNKITYPGGGYVEYEWGMSPDPQAVNSFPATQTGTGASMPNACTFEFTTPVVISRTVSFDGTHTAQSQTFSYATTWNSSDEWTSKTSQVQTTDGVTGNSFQTSYTYAPTAAATVPPFGTATFYNFTPVEQTVAHYDWNNTTTPLDTVTKAWYNQFQEACEIHTINTASGSISYGHFYTWTDGFISDDKAYDFQSGSGLASDCTSNTPPSSPTRETTSTFQSFTSPFSSSLTFAKPHIVTLYSGGTEIAQTQYAYDGSTVTGVTGLTSHDETHFGSGVSTGRGNLTQVTKVCISGTGCSANLVTTYTYDETGQLLTAKDACGNGTCSDVSGSGHTTAYSYADNYTTGGTPPGTTNTYLTGITFPTPPDGVALTESFAYSYLPGEVQSSVDENGQTTSYTYDSLYRLTKTVSPDTGISMVSYNDAPPSPSVTTCKWLSTTVTTGATCPISGAPSGTWTSGTTIMDGMGHTVHSETTTDPDAPSYTDYVDTAYDGEGRVYTKSNPHWTSSQPSDGTATLFYDALGRTVVQQQPDGSILQSCYNGVASTLPTGVSAVCNSHLGSVASGSWVDSTDELGNEWQRTSDSFGNLTEAMEPSGILQTPSMETDYTYNGFNDLLTVVQKGDGSGNRDRAFAYDSFAHLIGALNPETAGSVNSPTVGNTAPPALTCSGISGTWTTCYAYDLNGNLTQKTDNRNIYASYYYDNLNRVMKKTYSDGVTPTESFGYDGYTAAGSAISGVTNPKGRITQSTNNSNAASEYSYDSMGRPNQKSECIPGDCTFDIQLNPAYDLAGDLTQLSNGSTAQSVTFSYAYDSAVRLQSLTSSWSSADHPATLFLADSTLSGSTSYGPVGLLNASLGIPSGSGTAQVTQARLYDNRGRITAEAYNASAVSSSSATHSMGVITITPFNASDSASAQPGTGTVTISGTEQSTVINPCEPHSSCPETIYDSGTVTVTVNGTPYTTGYGEGMTSAALADNLASTITSGTVVSATADGAVITLTAKTKGASTDYSLSATSATSDPTYFSGPSFTPNTSGANLTGGSNGDSETVTATINGCSGNYTWGPSDTASTVASGLKSSIATHCSSTVSSSVTGTTVSLTSVSTGSSTNWPISVVVTHPTTAFFTATVNGMSGSCVQLYHSIRGIRRCQ
jgi:YD repeat-containing protein